MTPGPRADRWAGGPASPRAPGDFRAAPAGPADLMAETVGGHVTPVDQWRAPSRDNRAPYVARM